MNTQAIYNRLHRDVCSIEGEIPPLHASRAPIYEGLWKRLLTAIEEMGISMTNVVLMCSLPVKAGDESSECVSITYETAYGIQSLHEVPVELVNLVCRVLSSSDTRALTSLRQICLFTYKSKSNEVTKEQEETSVSAFCARNRTCASLSWSHYRLLAQGDSDIAKVLRLSKLLISIITNDWDVREIKPFHGPGAVSDSKRKKSSKWKALMARCCRVTDKMWPISEYFVPSPSEFSHSDAMFVDPICKLAIVPKDRRGPRVICTQPVGLMWVQQGLRRNLERTIETSPLLKTNRQVIGGPATSIKFDKQEANGGLALESSRTREFATIDLKDASDLVSWGLVRYLFRGDCTLALACSRATHVRLPNSKLEKLHMFAPMGSAMCFPIESLVFWAIAAAASYVRDGVTYETVRGFPASCWGPKYMPTASPASSWLAANSREVFVFGDDILVRSESCEYVCERLREVGFVPNLGKTFHKGFYRESCGIDAFHGVPLTIARLQNLSIASMSDAYALIDFVNRSRALGMTGVACYIEQEVETFLGFRLAAGITSGPIWRYDWPYDETGARKALEWNLRRGTEIRFNTRYQYFEAKTIICKPAPEREPEDGRIRLFRALTESFNPRLLTDRTHAAVDEHTNDWTNPDRQQYHLGWLRAF